MWILFGILSIACTVWNYLYVFKGKNCIQLFMCAVSFAFLTLLDQFHLVATWVKQEDWPALMDTVPSMFMMQVGYVVVIVAANGGALVLHQRKK